MQDRSPNIRINGHSADRVSNVALSDQIVKNCQLACPFCSPVWDCIGRCQSERFRKLQNRAAHHNNKFWLYDLISYYIRFWLAGIRLKKGVLDSWGGGGVTSPQWNFSKNISFEAGKRNCAIEVLHYGTALQQQPKPRPPLLALKNRCRQSNRLFFIILMTELYSFIW